MSQKLLERKAKIKSRDRAFEVVPGSVDVEKRTATYSISSEYPVRTYGPISSSSWGEIFEVLDHSPQAVDLKRMDGGSVRDTHWGDQVGVTMNPELKDKKLYISAKYSKGERADEIFQDLVDGIRRNVSVRYRVKEYRQDGHLDGVPLMRAVRWEVIHTAHVPDGADPTVGLNRSNETEEEREVVVQFLPDRTIKNEEEEKMLRLKTRLLDPGAGEGGGVIDVQVVRNEARDKERKRIAGIRAIVERHGPTNAKIQEEGRKAIEEGSEPNDFGMRALEILGEVRRIQANSGRPDSELNMSDKEVKQYSLTRALLTNNAGNLDGLEGEAHQEICRKLGSAPKNGGVFIPWNVQKRAYSEEQVRAIIENSRTTQQAAVGADGGFLVNTQNMGFIDILRPSPLTKQAGVQVISGLKNNVSMPIQTGTVTHYWIGENVDTTKSKTQYGVKSMSPKTVSAWTPMTRQLMIQSDPSIEVLVANDIRAVLERAVDKAILHGTGGVQPLGIAGTTGINDVTGTSMDWTKIVSFETKVFEGDAGEVGNMSWMVTPGISGSLKVTPKVSGKDNFISQGVVIPNQADRSVQSIDTVNGYVLRKTNQVTAGHMFFAAWSTVVLGEWGVLELKFVDQGDNYKSGGSEILAFYDVDVCVRQPKAISHSGNVTFA